MNLKPNQWILFINKSNKANLYHIDDIKNSIHILDGTFIFYDNVEEAEEHLTILNNLCN